MQHHQQKPTSVVTFSPISPSFNLYSNSDDETLVELQYRPRCFNYGNDWDSSVSR
ncbi:unnamed protein product, partial [Linum tenue]